ncbi:MAG: MoaD/ThiS family protein [Gammaproteobacteria bacterium]|nr:MoaD/ThiS family protein [Gammaproteobacteria bacterium]MCY4218082.1 MoaD/ThiS family protein [Gammaproteobacteria bacterium]MCY4276063.1 MoaD/ThiS family protein [Gammaproteobacteria bacterium]
MKITVKLFSSLMVYLPSGTSGNAIELIENSPLTPTDIMERLKVPREEVRTVMLNGTFLPEHERQKVLQDGDVLTVWPAIQGG